MAKMTAEEILRNPRSGWLARSRFAGYCGWAVVLFGVFLGTSLHVGGHMVGPTHIAPGNVGLVIDNYHGVVERSLMPAGTHWQGLWETVMEVPTSQRTISLNNSDADQRGEHRNNAVQVNTMSNMLQVDVSAQYRISAAHARDLYQRYQDQFADIKRFESENLEPAVKGAINYAIGDMDTATAMTTAGKQQAERSALKSLNDEWENRGVSFSNLMIRGIDQDDASKQLLATTLSKMQEIENARLALKQQAFENSTLVNKATAEARVNQLQNSTLTDLLVQDQMLGQVKKLYLSSDELAGVLKK